MGLPSNLSSNPRPLASVFSVDHSSRLLNLEDSVTVQLSASPTTSLELAHRLIVPRLLWADDLLDSDDMLMRAFNYGFLILRRRGWLKLAVHVHTVMLDNLMTGHIPVESSQNDQDDVSIFSFRDVSAQAKLNLLTQEKAQAMESAENARFVLNYVSHELRVPFSCLLLGLESIQFHLDHLPSDVAETLSIMQFSGEHMMRLLNGKQIMISLLSNQFSGVICFLCLFLCLQMLHYNICNNGTRRLS